MTKIIACMVFFVLLATGTLFVNGQGRNIWISGVPAGKDKISGKLAQWKNHIRKWGMDSSYNHALVLTARLNSNGWSGALYYQQQQTAARSVFWQLQCSEIRHEKQVRQQRANTVFPGLGKASPYIFGKINNLYTLQLGYGREQLLFPGLLEGNRSVSFRYQAGIALAMLKPYYLKLIYADPLDSTHQNAYVIAEKYRQDNAGHFLTTGYILGAAKWQKGLREIQYVPGLFMEGSFVLEPMQQKTVIRSVSFGAQAAVYARPLPIMALQKAYAWQGALFVGLSVGKRWK